MRPDDAATELEEMHRKAALAIRKPTRPADGSCHNCDEPLANGACYCDAECRDDHELRIRSQQHA